MSSLPVSSVDPAAGTLGAPVVVPVPQSAVETPELSEAERRRAGIEAQWTKGIDWPTTIWLVLLHVGVLAAPFCFTWKGLGLAIVLHWVTGSLGICLGFHRLLTHTGFSTYKPVRWFFAWLGQLAGEGSAVQWVAVHRKHHALSDKEGDPHSPRDGAWWSHMLWLAPNHSREEQQELHNHWAPDLARDKVIRFLDATFLLWHLLAGGVLFTIGWLGWDLYTGWSFLVYGMFLRLVLVLHTTWFVNSATHMWGYRNYETSDDSKNLWWVGLLAYGEGWHNNHHAYPRMAKHGHRWWEFDMTWGAIRLLKAVGLAWNVVDKIPNHKPR